MVLVRICRHLFDCGIDSAERCEARRPSGEKATCIFPFIYKGVKYNGCAPTVRYVLFFKKRRNNNIKNPKLRNKAEGINQRHGFLHSFISSILPFLFIPLLTPILGSHLGLSVSLVFSLKVPLEWSFICFQFDRQTNQPTNQPTDTGNLHFK